MRLTKEATVIFDKDDFPVDEWSDMVSGLGIDGLTVRWRTTPHCRA